MEKKNRRNNIEYPRVTSWGFEEYLMRKQGGYLRKLLCKDSKELLGIADETGSLDIYFFCRRYMFSQGFKRNYLIGFYKEDD